MAEATAPRPCPPPRNSMVPRFDQLPLVGHVLAALAWTWTPWPSDCLCFPEPPPSWTSWRGQGPRDHSPVRRLCDRLHDDRVGGRRILLSDRGDRWGRTKTLSASVLAYSIFNRPVGFSPSPGGFSASYRS